MTIASHLHNLLDSQGFTVHDRLAIFAIWKAVEWGQEDYRLLAFQKDNLTEGAVTRVEQQADAIARTYREFFKDAAKRKGVVG